MKGDQQMQPLEHRVDIEGAAEDKYFRISIYEGTQYVGKVADCFKRYNKVHGGANLYLCTKGSGDICSQKHSSK